MKKTGWSNKTKELRKGGATESQKEKVGKVMHEFKEGELHVGKSDKVVKNPKQAVAIALSEAGLSKKMKGGNIDYDFEIHNPKTIGLTIKNAGISELEYKKLHPATKIRLVKNSIEYLENEINSEKAKKNSILNKDGNPNKVTKQADLKIKKLNKDLQKYAAGGGVGFRNIDKIKLNIGEVVFNHITSLTKPQLEKQLSELKAELKVADEKSNRYTKLKDEEWYILYRLERVDEFEYAKGGGVGDKMKIKDWYVKEYSSDDLGEELNDDSTFKDLEDAIFSGNDVYSVLGVNDSVVRERAFAKLSKLNNKGGQWAYNNWLMYSEKYSNGGGVDINEMDIPVIRSQFEEEEFEYGDGGNIYSRKMRTPNGTISGKVEYNDFWKTYQVIIDGVVYEEFKTKEEAIQNLKNVGFDKMAKGGGFGDKKFYALWSDGMRNKKRQEILSVGYWKDRVAKHESTLENIQEFLAQVPFDETIAIYTDDDTSYYGELHSAYTPLYTAGAESVDAIVDSHDNIIWNKYERSKYVLKPNDYKMALGGGIKKEGTLDDGDHIQYEVNIHEINPKFNHKLYGTIEKDFDDNYAATYMNEMYDEHLYEKTFDSFEKAEKWVLDKINKEKNRYVTEFGNKMAKGGGIPNNYYGKTAEEVWNTWTEAQKLHFLHDHNLTDLHSSKIMIDYKELPSSIKMALINHVTTGQYALGGGVESQISEIKAKIEKAKANKIMPENLKKQYIEKYEKELAGLILEKGTRKDVKEFLEVPKGKTAKIVKVEPKIKYKIGDVVYNKKHNSIGIVRDVFDRNDLRTDADGVVYMDELEIYNSSNPKHQKAEIAPSTKKELGSKYKEPKDFSETLMEIDGNTWDSLNIEYGSQIKENESIQKKYIAALDKKINANMFKGVDTKDLRDKLEDENYHTLNNYLGLKGYYGESGKNDYKGYYDRSIAKGYKSFLNPALFEKESKSKAPKKESKTSKKYQYIPKKDIEQIKAKEGTFENKDILDGAYIKATGWKHKR